MQYPKMRRQLDPVGLQDVLCAIRSILARLRVGRPHARHSPQDQTSVHRVFPRHSSDRRTSLIKNVFADTHTPKTPIAMGSLTVLMPAQRVRHRFPTPVKLRKSRVVVIRPHLYPHLPTVAIPAFADGSPGILSRCCRIGCKCGR